MIAMQILSLQIAEYLSKHFNPKLNGLYNLHIEINELELMHLLHLTYKLGKHTVEEQQTPQEEDNISYLYNDNYKTYSKNRLTLGKRQKGEFCCST